MADRKTPIALAGYRSLTASEARSLGLNPKGSGRRYVSRKTKHVTAKTPTFTRRSVEQSNALGTTFEQVAKINYQRRIAFGQPRPVGGPGGSRYEWARDNYAYVYGMTKGEVRASKEFQQLYRWLKNAKRYRNKNRPAVNERHLREALLRLGLRDPSWSWAVGDTPSGYGRTYQQSIAIGPVPAYLREADETE